VRGRNGEHRPALPCGGRVRVDFRRWFRGENTNLPALVLEAPGHDVAWKLPVYNTIWHMLRNPMYAGAYRNRAITLTSSLWSEL
jgi:hypothetical protein